MENKDIAGKDEVAIPFDRGNLQAMFLYTIIMSLGGVALFDFLGSGILFGTPHKGWVLHGQPGLVVRGIFAVVLVLCCPCILFIAQWALFLGRCLWHDLPAVVFRRDGLVDNASYYRVGLIPWSALARAYPSDAPGLIRCNPPPRPVFLMLKDPTGFRARLPWLKAMSLRLEHVQGRLVISDGLMAVTSDEFVRRLNDYYGAYFPTDRRAMKPVG
jgi:hypothetical protein